MRATLDPMMWPRGQGRRGVYERKEVHTSWGVRIIIFILQKLSNLMSNLHLHISSNMRVLTIYL